jgi:ribonuclease D
METNTKYIDLDFLNIKEGDIEYICSEDSEISKLKTAFKGLMNADIIGLDSEWIKGTLPVKSVVVQLATRKKVYIIDFFGTCINSEWVSNPKFDKEFESHIVNLLNNDKILKVAWDFDLDLKNLNNRFGNRIKEVKNFVDIMPYHPKHLEKGFTSSCQNHLGRRLDKSTQNCDWGLRPLEKEKIIYCAIDAIAAIILYDKMKGLFELTPFTLTLKDVNKRMREYKNKKQLETIALMEKLKLN